MATIAQAAAHIYCSRAQFDQYLAEGVVTRQPSGQYDLDEVRRETFAHLRSVAAGRGGAAGDRLTAERVALTAAKRRREERQDQIEAGQVARVEPIVRFLQSALLAMRNRLLNLPGELAFVVAGRDQVEAFEAIDAGVREALEEISSPDFPARAAAAGLEAAKGEPRNNRSTENGEDDGATDMA
jgi:hypothetical protein